MRPFTKDNLVMVAIVAVIMVAAAVVVYLPQSRKLNRIRNDIASEQATLESTAQQASVVPGMVRQIEAMKGRYKDFDRRLPKRKELGEFLREISQNLQAEKLTNQVIEPGTPSQEELFHTLPIIMRFRGPYLALASFLERIDKMERLTRTQKLTIIADPKEDTVDITLQMNIYFTES